MKRGRKKKRGRPRIKRVSSIRRLKQAKKILGKGKHRDFVYLKCNCCGKIRTIHTQDKSIYTDEVKKNFICIFCK